MVGLLVVSVVVGVSSQNRLLSTSITVYHGSGILVKDFPGDTARVIQIAADNSVMPQLQQCARGDLSYQNDFFLSKEEFNDSSVALKFDELQANSASGKIGLWVCQPAFGNKVEFLSYHAAYIPRPILTVSRLVNQSDKLTLTNIPHHIGPVSLIATGPSGDILVTLTPNAHPERASVERSSSDFRMLAKFNPVFALSRWNGSVEFPILVEVIIDHAVEGRIEANDTSEVSSSR
eukprot:42826_1